MKEELDAYWVPVLKRNGLKSLIPPSEFFSNDLTEAYCMIRFWMREPDAIIVRMEEHELIAAAEEFWR